MARSKDAAKSVGTSQADRRSIIVILPTEQLLFNDEASQRTRFKVAIFGCREGPKTRNFTRRDLPVGAYGPHDAHRERQLFFDLGKFQIRHRR